jgi:hypothetical protein
MTGERLSRADAALAGGTLLFVVLFLIAVGTGLLPVSLDPVVRDPYWRRFGEIVLLRVLPLWTAIVLITLAVLGYARGLRRGAAPRAAFVPRSVLYVSLGVLFVTAIALERLAWGTKRVISSHWFWQVVFVVFLGGVTALVWVSRHHIRKELTRREERGETQKPPTQS